MGWILRDESHGGGVRSLWADGTISPLSLTDDVAGDPSTTEFLAAGDPSTSSCEVIGWICGCSCGWSGASWYRVPYVEMLDETRRLLYSPTDGLGREIEERLFFEEWRSHVQVPWSLQELGDRVRDRLLAEYEVDDAVTKARAAGATWAQVAEMAGITRQAAHRRWANPRPL